MSDPRQLWRSARRAVLGFASSSGPLVSPMAFWHDGCALWMTTSASATESRVLRRSPECAVYIPAQQREEPGLLARGSARVYGLDDPVALALHAPAISGALTALVVKYAGTVLGYSRDLGSLPPHWLPQRRAVLRIRLRDERTVLAASEPAGMAPALPSVVPSDVRRALSGRRDVTVAVGAPTGVTVLPGMWTAGLALQVAGPPLPEETPVAAMLDAGAAMRPTQVVGVVLHGHYAQGRLRPDRVTWWRGFEIRTQALPPLPVGGIELPE